jgi:uncharacterized protein YbaR (Trm112 family)
MPAGFQPFFRIRLVRGGPISLPGLPGGLGLEEDRLVCAVCGRGYPIVDGIPALIAGGLCWGTTPDNRRERLDPDAGSQAKTSYRRW